MNMAPFDIIVFPISMIAAIFLGVAVGSSLTKNEVKEIAATLSQTEDMLEEKNLEIAAMKNTLKQFISLNTRLGEISERNSQITYDAHWLVNEPKVN
jgi:hypothetical protein